MEQRKWVQRDRTIPVHETMFEYSKKVTKARLIATLKQVEEDEEIIDIDEVSGFQEAGFGSMDDEPRYYHFWQITVRKYTPESDDEYLSRKKTEQNYHALNEQRERLEYLRLKAKFETDL